MDFYGADVGVATEICRGIADAALQSTLETLETTRLMAQHNGVEELNKLARDLLESLVHTVDLEAGPSKDR